MYMGLPGTPALYRRLTERGRAGDSDPVRAADDEVRNELLELGSATLGESGGRAMRARIKPAWPGARLAAPALPVRCTPGDNLAIHVAVGSAPRGHVLVVDVGDVAERGYWGEVLTTGAESRGLSGLVIDGGVRDIDAIAAHGFPVFSATIALRGATKQ
jgi:4-hydroxy-4-methyl-2-oxoglutarate aldolase